MADHKNREHAILSASGAKRWMACPPSALLEEEFPDVNTVFSMEGTRAHEIAQESLECWKNFGYIEPENYEGHDHDIYLQVEPYIIKVVEDFNAIKAKHDDAVLLIERRVDFSDIVPKGFGTADIMIVADKRLYIRDLKFGKGVPVDAHDNPQIRLYAIGGLNYVREFYDIDEVTMEIHQPRLDSFTSETMTVQDLMEWAWKEVAPKAKLAIKGGGEFKTGSHCQFCKAQPKCRARFNEFDEAIAIHEKNAVPATLSEEEMDKIIPVLDDLKTYIESVEKYLVGELLAGKEFKNWKLVEGRSQRKYADQDKVVKILTENGFPEPVLFKRELLGITDMEKLIGKKKFAELLGEVVIKPPGKATLAPMTDKRPSIMATAKDDFADIKQED